MILLQSFSTLYESAKRIIFVLLKYIKCVGNLSDEISWMRLKSKN